MADLEEETPKGVMGNGKSEEEENAGSPTAMNDHHEQSFYSAIQCLISQIFFPVTDSQAAPLYRRFKNSLRGNLPVLRAASANSARDLLLWTRRGGPLRALFVISVGMITLVAMAGLLAFMLVFLAATANAVTISFLISVAVAGGFLALFFACLTAIYIGALSVAVFIISITTVITIFAVLIATGWVGFLWAMWLCLKKSVDITKHSLSLTGTALSAYSVAKRSHHHYLKNDMKMKS